MERQVCEPSIQKDLFVFPTQFIRNWNMVVGTDDHVWHLGDVSFGTIEATENILSRLNGIKHLITGNHDRKGRCQKLKWDTFFVDQHDYYRLKVKELKLIRWIPFSRN